MEFENEVPVTPTKIFDYIKKWINYYINDTIYYNILLFMKSGNTDDSFWKYLPTDEDQFELKQP